MPLFTKTQKPTYLNDADAAHTLGVSVSTAQAETYPGVNSPGWVLQNNTKDSNGNDRHRTEILVAMKGVTDTPVLSSIALAAVSVTTTTTTQAVVTATMSDASTSDVSADSVYTIDDPAVATVSVSGLVTGVTVGTAQLTATYKGHTTTSTVTVTQGV